MSRAKPWHLPKCLRIKAGRDGCHEQGLLEFLAYEPFYDNKNWSSLVLRKGETGLERLLPLCSLLKGVMLRRTKDDVGRPLCTCFPPFTIAV